MSDTRGRLLLVGGHVRALAQMAARAGYAVTAVDGFIDSDTSVVSEACVELPVMDAQGVRFLCERLAGENFSALIHGSGFEGHPDALAALHRHWPVQGNRPEVMALSGDPRRWCALLDQLGIAYPATRFDRPAETTGWLFKPGGACGGLGVRDAARPVQVAVQEGEDGCYQRRIDGPVLSVLFIADGHEAKLIGFNQLLPADNPMYAYAYGGAVGGLMPAEAFRARALDYVRLLTRELGLRGLNGLDMMLQGDSLLVLELNPRPTATLELHEPPLGTDWVSAHLRACAGELPDAMAQTGELRGARVLYAPAHLRIPPVDWPHWSADRPRAGSVVERGQPLCTLFARGAHEEELVRRLESRGQSLLAALGMRSRAAA